MFSKRSLDGKGFNLVIERRRSPMGVDVIHFLGLYSCIENGIVHHAKSAVTFLRRLRNMESIARHTIAHHLSKNGSPPPPGHLQFLQDQYPGTLADHKTIPVLVKRP